MGSSLGHGVLNNGRRNPNFTCPLAQDTRNTTVGNGNMNFTTNLYKIKRAKDVISPIMMDKSRNLHPLSPFANSNANPNANATAIANAYALANRNGLQQSKYQ